MNNGSSNEIFQLAAGYRNISLPLARFSLLPAFKHSHSDKTHRDYRLDWEPFPPLYHVLFAAFFLRFLTSKKIL